ncbi:hypothetical protein Bca4012_082113 [Brassica carinata]
MRKILTMKIEIKEEKNDDRERKTARKPSLAQIFGDIPRGLAGTFQIIRPSIYDTSDRLCALMIWLPIAKSHSITNFMSKELNDVIEKNTKKEITAIVLAIARAVTPAIEKTMSSAIIECFQRSDENPFTFLNSDHVEFPPLLGVEDKPYRDVVQTRLQQFWQA